MKLRIAVVAVVVFCAIGLWAWGGASPARAADGLQATGSESAYEYVGTKKCKSCHLETHKSWAKTKMGTAFETLMPGHGKEAKEKLDLDPDKDYSTDTQCLPCHTTGFGKPGGYEIPPEGDKRAARKAKNLAGVGCESCHGPGSGYVKILEEIDESQRTYSVEELRSAGLRKIDKSACVNCHNDKSPTFNPDAPFDFDKIMAEDKALPKGKASKIHTHKPLKLREG